MNILASLVLALLPQGSSFPKQSTLVPTPQASVPAPTPNYVIYGSLSRQRIVYTNLAQQDAERQLREYRKFREEMRRQNDLDKSNVSEPTHVYSQRPVVVRVLDSERYPQNRRSL